MLRERVEGELLIQEYMRSGPFASGGPMTAEEVFHTLHARYAIKAKRHEKHPNLVLFKYNQIDSPFAERIVRECRGIILDEADDWKVVSRAFDKFFNHGEGHAANIDWKSARVQEKVDGSLCVMYPYKGEWHVATSGTPDASGEVHGNLKKFSELFWETYDKSFLLPRVDCGHCLYFELTSPFNRIVVPHAESRLTLLGARNIETQEELAPAAAFEEILRGVMSKGRVVGEYPLGSFEEIEASFEKISPLSQEGYVVVDAYFNRVKVKHPGYVALHHAKDGLGTKAFVEIARSGETSEVITHFPEFQPMMDDASARLTTAVRAIEDVYETIKDIPGQKEFALEAVKTKCSAALFQLRAKRVGGVRQYFKDMNINTLMEILGYKAAA